MLQILKNAWKIPDLRKKLLFTLMMIVIFRLGSFIPVPGMNADAIKLMLGNAGEGNLLSFLDIFSGGAFSNATVFAMTIIPYINASIIMNLLTIAIPYLERLQKEGEEGRKKIAQYTRYFAILLALVQALGYYWSLSAARINDEFGNPVYAITNRSFLGALTIILTFTAGTAFLMWMGEKVNEHGIGNGISIIIFANIVSRLPAALNALLQLYQAGRLNVIGIALILIVATAAIAAVVFFSDAERRIPVQYAKRVVGRKMYGGQSTHIPIKVLLAGVIPIIFAMSILAFPTTIAGFFGKQGNDGTFWGSVLGFISPSSWFYGILYFMLIIAFTFFYTSVQYNPVEMSNNMKKNGGFIPGIRPGRPTSQFITKVLSRVTFVGAVFLGLIAVLPIFMSQGANLNISIGGTSLLIVVGVALETVKQIESQMLMRHYKGFLE